MKVTKNQDQSVNVWVIKKCSLNDVDPTVLAIQS